CADATLLAQRGGTVDERVIVVATGVGLEPNVQQLPVLPQGGGELRHIPVAAAQMTAVEAEASIERAARPSEPGGGESRRDQPTMRRPSGMNAFCPGAVGEEFERTRRLAARQPERVGKLLPVQTSHLAGDQRTRERPADASRMKAAVVKSAARYEAYTDVRFHARRQCRQQGTPVGRRFFTGGERGGHDAR